MPQKKLRNKKSPKKPIGESPKATNPAQYVVRAILDQIWENEELLFLVDWEGWDENGLSWDHTWEPESSFAPDCEIFLAWRAQHPFIPKSFEISKTKLDKEASDTKTETKAETETKAGA